MSDYLDRMIRAAKLDANLYEEVEADKDAMTQAMGVVILSSIAAGLGGFGGTSLGGLIGGAFFALLGWLFWSIVLYFVGTRLMPEEGRTEADYGQLLRTIGFASSPGLLRILGIISPLRGVVMLVTMFWVLAAMVVAVRQALDYSSTGRAAIVCIIGFVAAMLASLLLAAPFLCAAAA